MTFVTKILVKLGILKEDLDYHFVRASMVIIYFFFGYQKWFDYEAQGLTSAPSPPRSADARADQGETAKSGKTKSE